MSPDSETPVVRLALTDELLDATLSETQWSDPFRASDVCGSFLPLSDGDIGEFDAAPDEWV